MISALADAGAVLERADYLDAARAARRLRAARPARRRRPPAAHLQGRRGRSNAYLEDHAFLLEALLVLYEATFEPRWFTAARELADTMIERFADDERGGFFETSSDHERLVARRKDPEDHPIPSGNASAAYGLLRLAALTGEHAYEDSAVGVLRLLHPLAPRHPQAFAHLLQALDFHLSPTARWRWPGTTPAPLERGRARRVPAPHRARRRRARRRAAAGGPRRGRRPAPPPMCASASPASAR